MFNLFKKKKKKTIEEHISFITNNKINFQLDVLRDGDVDFQIFRQRMLKSLGVSTNNPDGVTILLSFNLKNLYSTGHYENFKSLPFYEECEKIKILENPNDDYDLSFIAKVDNSEKEILSLIYLIQTKIFNYDDDTLYLFSFKEI